MSIEQKQIIEDTKTKAIMILAGPGSGKTKVLVHKIASLLLTEDIKPEQFMMLTFSKSARNEFKSRLNDLIGALSYDVEIQTFHSYALKLIARVANKNSNEVLQNSIVEATRQINEKELNLPHIAVLILDEYQDINEESFLFVKAIYNANEGDTKIIAVGDDDQCIMGFNGANIDYINRFKKEFSINENGKESFKQFELLCNFRSKKNIVEYSNEFIEKVNTRYKIDRLYSNSPSSGVVNIYSYLSPNYINPLIELIKNDEKQENIAILAKTNEEVMDIYSKLHQNGIDAKFLIDREKFELKNIIELAEFNKLVNEFIKNENSYKEIYFEKALQIIENRYKTSTNIELLYKIVDRFLTQSDDYFISQWISYIEEIKLEDFDNYKKSILVSTIHKSKGLEFDKVYVIVDRNPSYDDEKRVFYVGMTRAKSELSILRQGKDIEHKKEYINYFFDEKNYLKDEKTYTHIMSLSDIKLGIDSSKYGNKDIVAGENLTIKKGKFDNFVLIKDSRIVAVFSNRFDELLKEKINNGFIVKSCVIEYVVLWEDRENSKTLRHPLCKIDLTLID